MESGVTVIYSPVARSREVSKTRDPGLVFSNRFEIWQASVQRCEMPVEFQSDTIITSNLAASRLHEILL